MKTIIDELGVRTEVSDRDEVTIKHAVSFTHDIVVDGNIRVSSLRTLDGATYGTGSLASYDVVSYAPDGTARNGTVDWTTYFQAAIDAATGNADPATNARTPVAAVYIPAGQYLITAPIVIRSVQGFRLIGDGPRLTVLYVANGFDLDSLLEIDGSAWGVFANFTLHSTGTGRADKMLNLHWSTAAARSTTGNSFYSITISGTNRTAFAIGTIADELGRQVDDTALFGCVVTGQWTAGEATNWQNAYEIGNGTAGNNINHRMFGCGWALARYGIRLASSSVYIYGADGGGGESAVYVTGTGPLLMDGVRVEGAQRLLYWIAGAGAAQVTLRGIVYAGNYLHADNRWIHFSSGGSLVLENVACHYAPAPVVHINAAGTTSGMTSCLARSIASQTAYPAAFELVNAAYLSLTVQNYQQLRSNLTVETITPFAITGSGLNWTPS